MIYFKPHKAVSAAVLRMYDCLPNIHTSQHQRQALLLPLHLCWPKTSCFSSPHIFFCGCKYNTQSKANLSCSCTIFVISGRVIWPLGTCVTIGHMLAVMCKHVLLMLDTYKTQKECDISDLQPMCSYQCENNVQPVLLYNKPGSAALQF